jgi:hypothetical protein
MGGLLLVELHRLFEQISLMGWKLVLILGLLDLRMLIKLPFYRHFPFCYAWHNMHERLEGRGHS